MWCIDVMIPWSCAQFLQAFTKSLETLIVVNTTTIVVVFFHHPLLTTPDVVGNHRCTPRVGFTSAMSRDLTLTWMRRTFQSKAKPCNGCQQPTNATTTPQDRYNCEVTPTFPPPSCEACRHDPPTARQRRRADGRIYGQIDRHRQTQIACYFYTLACILL